MCFYPFPVVIGLLLISPALAFGQNNASVPDPDPELERKTFILPPGFEVNLFAADPLLAKPIQMNFDPQGRLWVASSEIYPQIKPGEIANDKIIILEDTQGVGRADKTTVFADGLLIPTGVVPGDGGAYVANSTELLHLSASEPGKKADKKRIVLSGFGTEDTHHILHTLRWGPDCHLYFNQSVYIHSHIETPSGVKRLNAGGIWRFNPDRCELDVFVRGFWNPWGHAFDRFGQSMITDGANGEGITHGVPGASYPAAVGPNASRLLHGMNPGSPKHCGLEIISGRHFPDDWQGDCITNDFRGHRVCRFKLQEDGSTFASREMTEVIKSNHPAFRPIDVKMGPDGALYIADWYNPIIQHGEVDFRDPRRDKTHGRIWRVTAKGRPLVPRPKLLDTTIAELLEHLKDPELWTRQQARRVLKERGKEKVLPELYQWIARQPDNPSQELVWLEALWMGESFGTLVDLPAQSELENPWASLLVRTLGTAKSPDVLAQAVRILGRSGLDPEMKAKIMTKVDSGVNSHFPRVRLEAIRAFAALKLPNAVDRVLDALNHPMDRTLDYALWLTVRELEPYWMPEFQAGRLTFGGQAKKLAFALSAVGNQQAIKPVVTLIESGQVPPENVFGLWRLLAEIGGADELGKVLTYTARAKQLTVAQKAELLQTLEKTARSRKVVAPRDISAFSELLSSEEAVKRVALKLVGLWKVKAHLETLAEIAESETSSTAIRLAAMEGLAECGDARATSLLKGLCEKGKTSEIRRLAITAMAGNDPSAAAVYAAEFLSTASPEPVLVELYAAFLARKTAVPALVKSLNGQKLNADVAKFGLQAIRSSTLNVPELSDALIKAGNLNASRKPATAEEIKALTAESLQIGDAQRGEVVFRRRELQCLACHAIGGAGGQVGPDLSSIGASAQPDYLVESILLPSKAIKEGYHSLRIVTQDDKVALGIKVREEGGQLILRTAEGTEISIPVKDIAERNEAKSLMPEGLADTLSRQEFADLVRFLCEMGKVGPYAPSQARVVRRWQVIEPTSANLDLFRRNRVSTAAEPDAAFAWQALYSRVSGELPLADLPRFSVWSNTAEQSIVRFQLDVTTGGAATLKLNSADGLAMFVGSVPQEAKPRMLLDLKPGLQTITIVIDRSKRAEPLRLELEDAPQSPARVAMVGGK